MRRTPYILAFILGIITTGCILPLTSCASRSTITSIDNETIHANSAHQVYAQYANHLATSARIYESLMIAAGEAHSDGLITDSQAEQILAIGKQVRQSLLLAKSALKVYSSSGDIQAGKTLSERMLEYDRLLLQLRDLATQGGVL